MQRNGTAVAARGAATARSSRARRLVLVAGLVLVLLPLGRLLYRRRCGRLRLFVHGLSLCCYLRCPEHERHARHAGRAWSTDRSADARGRRRRRADDVVVLVHLHDRRSDNRRDSGDQRDGTDDHRRVGQERRRQRPPHRRHRPAISQRDGRGKRGLQTPHNPDEQQLVVVHRQHRRNDFGDAADPAANAEPARRQHRDGLLQVRPRRSSHDDVGRPAPRGRPSIHR